MEIECHINADIALVVLKGRFDAHGASQFDGQMTPDVLSAKALCIDLADVDYISSAGVHILVRELKRLDRPELIALVNPGKYVREVLRVTGVERLFRIYGKRGEAMMALRGRLSGGYRRKHGEETTPLGTFMYQTGSDVPTGLDVIGNVADVLHARVTSQMLVNKRFSEKEYSIGLGALGASAEDCMPLLGEMITVGGTMVWLPTDGNDTPDFLIPQSDSELIRIRTAFNAALVGAFNEYCLFRAAGARGATLDQLYAHLFDHARAQRGESAGVLALAMCARFTTVYGSGVTRAPISADAPRDGEMIIAPGHMDEWFEADRNPRHTNVTALVVGFGANLEADLSAYERGNLDAVFYIHPANVGDRKRLLHNHAVLFDPLPLPPDDAALEDVTRHTVDNGSFIDMRHLLDTTRVNHALIGVSYIEHIHRHKAG